MNQYAERRQAEQRGMRPTMAGDWLAHHLTAIAYAAAPIDLLIAIEHFAIWPGLRQSEPITLPRHRGEVAYEDQRLLPFATTHKGDDTVFRM